MIKYVLMLCLMACINLEKSDLYTIKKVIDGDTVTIDDGSEKGIRVRLIGINAPEPRNYKHRREEPYGKEASKFLKEMLQDKKVYLEYDIEQQDQYGRDLAYLFLEDGTFVNDSMLKAGYAEVMTFPPNVKYVDRFVKSQQEAKAAKRGIWSDL